MAYKPLFGSREREAIWCREATNAYIAERGHFPICVHCDKPVYADDDWHISHVGRPACFGGKRTGVGHATCNRDDNANVVTPMFHKANRQHQKHIGLKGPGLSRHAMRAGRRSIESKTFRHGVVPRLTLSEKIARMRARLTIRPLEGEVLQ